MNTISVPSPADFHVHLREGPVSELVTPHVRLGGIDVAYIMVRTLLSASVAQAIPP